LFLKEKMSKEDCAFCNRTKFEERIIAEIDNFYVVASLGQITEGGYTLLIPKEHTPCMAALDASRAKSAISIAIKIRNAVSKEFRFNPFKKYPVTMFEHGVVGQSVKHAHLHFLPAVLDITPKVLTDFTGCEVNEITNYLFLRDIYESRQEPYLFWTALNGKGMICWNPPAPLQYLRTVAAEILGYPERANWRSMDPELDKQFWQKTIARLKPYF